MATSLSARLLRKFKQLAIIILLVAIQYGESIIVDNNPYHHREVLDTRGKYILEWLVDKPSSTITFNVTVKTLGYIGLGLNKNGVMRGADIVVGGVDGSGKAYFTDMHVTKNRTLRADPSQDWTLLGHWEKGGRTSLSFSRLFDTCDGNDYPITSDHITIIWAYGENDAIGHHYQNRGTFSVYLLDPELSPDIDNLVAQRNQPSRTTDSGPVQLWKLVRRYQLKPQRTSYWCTMHAGPKLPHKHHIIGFRTYLENELARRHTHHLLVYRCQAPEGIDPQIIFEPFTKYPGEECYLNENRRLPINLCREVVSVYGYGGKPFFLPESVGFPIGAQQNEYYLFETHYDNPDLRSDLEFEAGVEYYISPKTRPRDGGIITVGFDIPGSLAAIPPGSPDFDLIGQCNPNCTATMSPPQGIDVVAVGLHAHLAARKIRLLQFRGNVEMEWLMNDDNYNPNFQQVRLLDKERKIMPNDQLVSRCNYDNTDANGTTITGFGTPDEMCLSFLVIANKIPYSRCTSEYPARKLLDVFGVQDVVWDIVRQQRVATGPRHLQGLTLGQVGDWHVKWTEELRKQLERDQMFTPHVVSCPDTNPPSAAEFIASFAAQIGTNIAPNIVRGGGQALREVITQGIGQVVQLGITGLRDALQPGGGGAGVGQIGQGLGGVLSSLVGGLGQQAGGSASAPQPQPAVVIPGLPPIFPQGTPPTGVSGLGMPPNSVFPASAIVYQPPPTCKSPSPTRKFLEAATPQYRDIPLPVIQNEVRLKRKFI